MTPLDCAREPDVVDAVRSQRWPDRADDDLRAHVANCAICADVAEVASAIHAECDAALAESVSLPPSHVIWLRAQARARTEALRDAARPIAVMQAIGLASATAMVSLAIGAVAYWVWTRTAWFQSLALLEVAAFDAMGIAIRGTLLAIGLWLILAPVAVYLVASDD